MPEGVLGGEKGRLIHFANWIGASDVNIRMFADADYDRLLERPSPERVWLTDQRDMEGYVLSEKCIDKMLRVGLGTDRFAAQHIIGLIRRLGRKLGLIRVLSELDSLDLPFQKTDLKRHFKTDANTVTLDLDGYLRALLQNAAISLAEMERIKERLGQVEKKYWTTPDSEIVHGKDAICIIEVTLATCEVRSGDACRLLWTSFESAFIEAGSTLETITVFLKGE
jgi:hypothetical protein